MIFFSGRNSFNCDFPGLTSDLTFWFDFWFDFCEVHFTSLVKRLEGNSSIEQQKCKGRTNVIDVYFRKWNFIIRLPSDIKI